MKFESCLDQEAPALLARDGLPGAAIALIENGAIRLARTWGFADIPSGRAVGQDTLFNVASISNAVTSWGVMRLIERGELDLDRPVESYLGAWRLPASAWDHCLITARSLLSHTAGINTEGIKGVAATDPQYTTLDVLEGRLPPLDEQQRQYCRDWGSDPDRDREPLSVKFPPGEAFHYSNLGFTLLQLLIEEIDGRPFARFMQDEVLDPLGMLNAGFAPPDPSNPRLATAYGADGSALPFYRHVALAAGGLYCSIEHLARFACAELAGGCGVISERSLATLFERQCYAESLEGLDFDSALGHYLLKAGDRIFVHHTGGVPGWRSVYGVIPQSGHGFCALINSDGGNPFWMELIRAWFESL